MAPDRINSSFYENCTILELDTFARARGLSHPSPQSHTLWPRAQYIEILQQDHQTRTFRFMNLPPELRGFVYENLLTMPHGSKTCHNEILRVSRLVHREAGPVLYAKNTMDCVLSSFKHEAWQEDQSTALLHGKKLVKCHELDSKTSFPRYLRSVQHLCISIRGPLLVTLPARKVSVKDIRFMLAKLTSHLMDANELKTLVVDVYPGVISTNNEQSALLFPLRRLRNFQELTITGDISTTTRAAILADVTSTRPAINVLKYWRLLSTEAQAYETLRQELDAAQKHDHGYFCGCAYCEPDEYEELSTAERIGTAHRAARTTMMNCDDSQGSAGNERKALEALEDLGAALAQVERYRLHRALRRYDEAREERRKYVANHCLTPSLDPGPSAADYA